MSAMKLEDIAFVRFRAPDLDRMRGFPQDFGLRTAATAHDGLTQQRSKTCNERPTW